MAQAWDDARTRWHQDGWHRAVWGQDTRGKMSQGQLHPGAEWHRVCMCQEQDGRRLWDGSWVAWMEVGMKVGGTGTHGMGTGWYDDKRHGGQDCMGLGPRRSGVEWEQGGTGMGPPRDGDRGVPGIGRHEDLVSRTGWCGDSVSRGQHSITAGHGGGHEARCQLVAAMGTVPGRVEKPEPPDFSRSSSSASSFGSAAEEPGEPGRVRGHRVVGPGGQCGLGNASLTTPATSGEPLALGEPPRRLY